MVINTIDFLSSVIQIATSSAYHVLFCNTVRRDEGLLTTLFLLSLLSLIYRTSKGDVNCHVVLTLESLLLILATKVLDSNEELRNFLTELRSHKVTKHDVKNLLRVSQ